MKPGFVDGWIVNTLVTCGWVEGDRTFNLIFGAISGGLCLAAALPILWWWVPWDRVYLFTREVDPHQVLQILYGAACMAMASANFICRFVRHFPLPWVHPAFFYVTLILVAGLGPRVIWVALHKERASAGAPLRPAPAR